jgi:predicted dehydrogenase
MQHTYRAGIIGCGGIGRRHAAAFAQIDNVELVAGADPSDKREADYRALGMQRFYGSAEEMLATEDLHLVAVCTPPTEHAANTIAAAEAGARGIVCEKPMAMDLTECDAMIEACERHRVKLAIGHQRRYGAQFIKGRDLLASGTFGEPLMLYGATPGADVMLWGVHWLDMFHFLMPGRAVAHVMGQVDVEQQRVTSHGFVEDALLGHLTFDNGVRAILECGDLAEPGADRPREATIRIHGTRATFKVTDARSTLWAGEVCEDEPIASPFVHKGEQPDVQMWIDQTQELIDCIEQDTEHQCDGRAGRRTIELTCAIWESAVSHRLVKLPLEPGESSLHALWRDDGQAS